VEAPKPAPVSYATLTYFGVNSFKFTNAKGTATFGRYQLQPMAGEHFLTKEQLAAMGPDYLTTDILQRVRRGPVKFKLLLQVAGKTTRSTSSADTRKKIVRHAPSPKLWRTAKPQRKSYSSCREHWFQVSKQPIR
jgi:catalase